jgi:hypothetical protein
MLDQIKFKAFIKCLEQWNPEPPFSRPNREVSVDKEESGIFLFVIYFQLQEKKCFITFGLDGEEIKYKLKRQGFAAELYEMFDWQLELILSDQEHDQYPLE